MPTWDCGACAEEQEVKGITVPGSKICVACFRYLFELAIQDESEFPAHWGATKLDYTLYRNHLGEDLYNRYEAKKREYAVPLPQRMYCKRTDPPRRPDPCGNFVGQWADRKECIRCNKCMWYTCLRCEETFSTSESSGERVSLDHECDPDRDSQVRQRALAGLERGKDYQICPNTSCQRIWGLWDGCNHLKCYCKTYFCYICGVQTRRDYSHWQAASCPLYGSASNQEPLEIPPEGRDDLFGDIAQLYDQATLNPTLSPEEVEQRLQLLEREQFDDWRRHVGVAHEYVLEALTAGAWPNMQAIWMDGRQYTDSRRRFITRMGSFIWRAVPVGAPSDWQNPLRLELGLPEFPPVRPGYAWSSEQYGIYVVPDEAMANGRLARPILETIAQQVRLHHVQGGPDLVMYRDIRQQAHEQAQRVEEDRVQPFRDRWDRGPEFRPGRGLLANLLGRFRRAPRIRRQGMAAMRQPAPPLVPEIVRDPDQARRWEAFREQHRRREDRER